LTEYQCELSLENNPTDNYARMRLAEIYIIEERNLDEAKQLLEVIKSADPKFLASERCEMLGDIEYSDSV